MKIRTRLSLYFTLISSGTLLLVLLALYFAVFGFLKTDFNKRLSDRVNVAAQLYLKADEIGADSLVQVQQKYLEKLPNEVIRVYNDGNKAAFVSSNGIYWRNSTIEEVRRKGEIEYEEENRQVIGRYFHDNQGNFVILASAVDRNFNPRVTMLARITLILFLGFSAILFFAGQWFASKSLAPIQRIIGEIRHIRSSNLHLRIAGVKNNDEIAELISNFNNLLERLENAFELQRSFVSNASHELRTPLTSIMGEADVALEKARSPQEYNRVLQSISNDAMHLQATITSLMELAQVDFNYTQTVLQPVRMDELMWELNEYWIEKKGTDKLILQFKEFPEDENALVIMANKSLLAIALNNIIDNAFKYSKDAAVNVTFDARQDTIQIEITDKGTGIKAEDIDQIFKSFYRAEGTRNHVQGSGIGLYIAGKIIQLCNGTIKVVSDGSSGSSFILTFIKSR
ncbi:sensor histidine kinase [Mucilaginibacter aquatilis]|uniref:histidine kinase n=1 Tax=Mucilaginibacter aquatilis TaxID=1517760 RepID=A0A6I4I6M2_9SPHI|nr:HAMP domain-containing sensor histidine kinase [Mucilaginibacter aquatilis]MVN90800.1 HAMP domain-containing protein [Mucilaginibacter aquatilis]